MSIDYTTNFLGDITFDGYPLIHLTDQAVTDIVYQVAGDSYVQYVAPGRDDEGNKYLVYWNTTPEWDNMRDKDDESLACDWDNHVAVVEK
jgi:hypothetical protein